MKKVKILCMLIPAIIMLSKTSAIAQREKNFENNKEKIEAQKVAFITTKLKLTTDEATKFWPVYNEYEAKREAIRKNFRSTNKPISPDSLTDAQAKDRITAELKMEQSLLDLKGEYTTKFYSVLPAQKVLKLVKTEEEFKKVLLNMLKDKPAKPQK